MQLVDLNSSNWKPVDSRDRLANGQPELQRHRVRLVSSNSHREAGRSHSGGAAAAAAQAMNLCAAQPNNQACVALALIADGRWRERCGGGMKKQSKTRFGACGGLRQSNGRQSLDAET